ncbi:hypothetical protein M662_07450 [Bacillus sp. SB49]|uniref:hypothetical protein n=1 Tax=Bacillus sp. SB49 TaxID=1071080 RepID=UPI00047ABDBE|nr:hypothetical protein [Bacillus sp. SB49]QHT46336.1 hypothetical protein M662_07450 [Bacillus sp. SB49]
MKVLLLRRKLLSALITTVIASIIVTLVTPPHMLLGEQQSPGFVSSFSIVAGYISIGVFLYGLPISIVSDLITKKWGAARFFFSYAFHIFAGILPLFILWTFTFYSLVIAVFYFVIDELLRSRSGKKQPMKGR